MIPRTPKWKEPSSTAPEPQVGAARSVTRRGLIEAGAGAAAAAMVSRPALAQEGDNLPPSIPEWQLQPGEETLSQPYGRPSKFEANVVRRYRHGLPEPPTRLSSFSLTPLQDLCGIITPNGLHYERHHAGVPRIDPLEHRLIVHGMVERPIIFAMEDLTRFPSVSRVHFLECSGNTQNWRAPKPELTVQDTHGLLSCCEWTGVPLATVLAEAGVRPEARWMLAEGADAAAMTRSIPIEKALDDALLAYAQNGERLRPEQGYPLRLLLPGYEGNTSVKWLRRLKLGPEPFQTREETSKYTLLMPDGVARQFNFVMEAKSVITLPSGGQRLGAPGFYEISGLAWSGNGKVARSRSVDRRRRLQARRGVAGAGHVEVPDAVPLALALGRRRGDACEPRHRRDRLCAANSRSAAQRARRAVLLSLQRNSELERRGWRRGDQCRVKSPASRRSQSP